jgi:hypothetical protein
LPDIFVVIEKQLGLKLVKTKGIPLEVIVVDHVDKVPTGNYFSVITRACVVLLRTSAWTKVRP